MRFGRSRVGTRAGAQADSPARHPERRPPAQWRGNCCIFHDLRAQPDEIGCNRAAVSASKCLEDQFRDGCDNIEAREFVRNYAAPAFEAALSPDGLITLTPSFQKIKKFIKMESSIMPLRLEFAYLKGGMPTNGSL